MLFIFATRCLLTLPPPLRFMMMITPLILCHMIFQAFATPMMHYTMLRAPPSHHYFGMADISCLRHFAIMFKIRRYAMLMRHDDAAAMLLPH